MAETVKAFKQTISWKYSKNALVVAIIVGTILNLINQSDVIMSSDAVDWPKAVLTYLVPYLVATYGTYNALRNTVNVQR